jgi:hypothetical protein
MANIREDNAPAGLGLQPTEMGADARLQVARRGGAFYNQAAEALAGTGQRIGSTITDVGKVADDYVTHRDISQGAKDGTGIVANANTQWNEIAKKSDPNDPATAQKFLTETLEPALDKFKEGFTTERSRQWAEQFTDQYRKHMFEKTASDMSTLAGIAVQQNVHQTVNQLSSAAASDPSSLDFALKTIDHSIGGMVSSSPNLDAETGAKVNAQLTQQAKEAVVKAAVSGMIQKNPNVDLDAIQKKYPEYINGAEIKMFQKAAQTQAKVDTLQNKQLETYTRQTNERAAEHAANQNLSKNVTIDPQTSRPVIKPDFFSDALEIAKMPDAPAGTARALIDWGEHQQNAKAENVIDDPIIKKDLTDRLFDSDKPTTRIDLMKAQVKGQLSNNSFQAMERLVTELETSPLKGPVWDSTATAVKDALIVNVPGLPGKDSVGTANYATFMQTFIPQYLAKERAGNLPPNALDVKDPNSMISQAMAPFKRTQGQRMQDYVGAAGGIGAKPEPAVQPSNQQTRMVGDVPVPIALNGVASLQFNKAKNLWRDQTSGTVYDAKGHEVKP